MYWIEFNLIEPYQTSQNLACGCKWSAKLMWQFVQNLHRKSTPLFNLQSSEGRFAPKVSRKLRVPETFWQKANCRLLVVRLSMHLLRISHCERRLIKRSSPFLLVTASWWSPWISAGSHLRSVAGCALPSGLWSPESRHSSLRELLFSKVAQAFNRFYELSFANLSIFEFHMPYGNLLDAHYIAQDAAR